MEKEEIDTTLVLIESQISTKIETYNLDRYKLLERKGFIRISETELGKTAQITTEGKEYIRKLGT